MPSVEAFFHDATSTLTYVVYDPETKDAVVIDTVLDYDPESETKTTTHADKIADFITANNLKLHWILDTHPHADHLTGAKQFKAKFPEAKVGIGEGVKIVQETFAPVFGFGDEFKRDGSQFDVLFTDLQEVEAGSLKFKVIFTPGHTPACACYNIDDCLFTGDSIFMPDFGTGRCDFPNGDAKKLYASIQRIYALPDATRIFVGHDYQPGGRELKYETTVAEQKASNKHVKAETTEEEFVKFRTERDAQLNEPRLLKPSIKANIQAGVDTQ
eukprot:m.58970 g.58970  ORF g.58970 m.58970 type:complete len:271 (-) comp11740_c0_seq2:151-963(-)